MTTSRHANVSAINKTKKGVVEKWPLPDWSPQTPERVKMFTTTARGNCGSISQLPLKASAAAEINTTINDQHSSNETDGHEHDMQAARQQLAEQTQEVSALLGALENPVRCVTEEVVAELLLLAQEIANSILQKELQNDPTQLMKLVGEAVDKLPSEQTQCEVLINPQDLKLLNGLKSADKESNGRDNIEWIEDDTIERSNFIVKQGQSRLHAGIATMLTQAISSASAAAKTK